MQVQIKNLESNLSILSRELVELKELIASSFTKVNNNFGLIDSRLSLLDRKVNELNFKMDNLDGNTTKGFTDVGGKIETLTEEIQKISIVTQYHEMYKNQQDLKN